VRETLLVVAIVALAILLRLILASRGWPPINSDEATLGLMTVDILQHGARPVFFYGQNYMGALQAYLAVPAFAILGPTSFALHLTTTLQFATFLLIIYCFTRAVYSPGVALLTIALLALGPDAALFLDLRAGAGIQDTLVFAALLTWLVYLRLRRPRAQWARVGLDLGIGAAAGLGVWADLLILPFVLAAGVALAADMLRQARGRELLHAARAASGRTLLMAAGFAVGAAPFIAANIASHGATLAQTLGATGPGSAGGHASPGDHLVALGEQVAVTLFAGLPHVLGSQVVCAGCPTWPTPNANVPAAAALRAAVISLPFSILAFTFWALAAAPLGRDLWRWALHPPQRTPEVPPRNSDRTGGCDARWWGRALLVMSGALTVLAYMASHIVWYFAGIDRYLAGLYVCAPLAAAPLCRGGTQVWRWITTCGRTGSKQARPHLAALLAVELLVAIVAVEAAGAATALAMAGDGQVYGVPAGARDLRVIAFARTHDATQFYTTYWVCNRLMFEAADGLRCAVVSDGDAFAPGLNRVAGSWAALRAVSHPAYIFDAQAAGGLPPAEHQVDAMLAAHDPRFAGYVRANVAGFDLYYYTG
jgi:hypothetical protein